MPQVIDKPVSRHSADADDTELVPASDPRAGIISIDPERMWGIPCFVGTRLPVKSLFDYLENGADLDDFLNDFDGVSREMCKEALRLASKRLLEGAPSGDSAQ